MGVRIGLVVNLTVPAAHAEVDLLALRAAGHVWSEKPPATSLEGAGRVLDLPPESGPRVSRAPDTGLGPVTTVTAIGGRTRGERADPAGPGQGTVPPIESAPEVWSATASQT